MASFITSLSGAGSTSPDLVLGYTAARDSRNVVHDLIGGGLAVALIAPRMRSGELALLYKDETTAWDALNLHSHESAFSLTETDHPQVSMTYVLRPGSGASLALDDATRAVWVLTVPFQEISN